MYVGAAQNIFSKASKYSLFDPCKARGVWHQKRAPLAR